MGHRPATLRILVLHNHDFDEADAGSPAFLSRADVVNAARDVASALATRGHAVELAAVDGDSVFQLPARIAAARPDVVFNLCESLHGDNRHEVVVPTLLDLARVAYTGSGPLALGLALRKDRAKQILRSHGVPTPESIVLRTASVDAVELPFPLIVKPTREDASVGIDAASVVGDRAALSRAVERVVVGMGQPALVERFIAGRELYVSLLGNAPPEALPFHEIDFSAMPDGFPHIVSYAGKWDEASAEFAGTRPLRCALDEEARDRVASAASAAFSALGLADYGRVDLRLAADGTPHVIDVNPNCDVSAGAGFALSASYAGLDYPTLVERICHVALERHHDEHRHLHGAPQVIALDPAHPGRGSFAARVDHREGRPVQRRGAEGRARADRRRAR
jgi:D-alanine-D-alanine ligase